MLGQLSHPGGGNLAQLGHPSVGNLGHPSLGNLAQLGHPTLRYPDLLLKVSITINVPLFKKLRDIIFFCGTITL